MRDANSGIGHIDVLTARARRTICVHAQIFILDFNFDVFINFRRNEHRSKRRFAASARIERRDSDQPMNARFGRQKSVSVFAFDAKSRRFYSGFAARLFVQNFGFKTFFFRPAQIHSQKHLRKILRVRSARARLNRADRIVRVRLSRQKTSVSASVTSVSSLARSELIHLKNFHRFRQIQVKFPRRKLTVSKFFCRSRAFSMRLRC